ncbi:hypothetical protein O3M35_007555 [Rhynocoris fuscipes]|uniref:NADH dehydrogenase [ubiquinone] 1 alpha subcomplex subunit 13 n=1 Tax=Rhynocoris fuscipes TaxID=488301 RepID=A0AAW1DAP0_9HEMI
MATCVRKKQDMPPPGGFQPINTSRIPAKTIFGAKTLIAGHFIFTAGSLYLYYLTHRKVHMEEVERRSSMFAILPMIQAERDRAYLKQLRRNREEERKLMENVDGWVVGTYRGEPIYKTNPPDTLVQPSEQEYYVHSSDKDFRARRYISLWD